MKSPDIFKNFSRRRKVSWFLCVMPASFILSTWYFIGDTWLWVVAVPLVLILALGEVIRHQRMLRRQRTRKSFDATSDDGEP